MAGNLGAAASSVNTQNASAYINTTSPTDAISTGPSRAMEIANRLISSNGSTPAVFLAPPMGAGTIPAHTSRTNEPRIAQNYSALNMGFTCIGDKDIVFVRGVNDIAQASGGETSRRVPGEPLPAGGYAINLAMVNAIIASYQLARLVKRKEQDDTAAPGTVPDVHRIRFDVAQYRPDVSGQIDEIAAIFKPQGCVRDQVGANGGGDVTAFEAGMYSKGYTSRGKLLNIGLTGRNFIMNTSREATQPGDYVIAVLVPRRVGFDEEFGMALERPASIIGGAITNPQQYGDVDILSEDRTPGDNPWVKAQTRPAKRSLSSDYFTEMYGRSDAVRGAAVAMKAQAMNRSSSAIIYQWEIYPMFDKNIPSQFVEVQYDMFVDAATTVQAIARDYRKCIVAVARAPHRPHQQLGEHQIKQRISKATNLSRDYQSLRAQGVTEVYMFANHPVAV